MNSWEKRLLSALKILLIINCSVVFSLFTVSLYGQRQTYEPVQGQAFNKAGHEEKPFDPEAELKRIDELLESGDRSAEIFYNRGWIYEYMDDLESAEEEYTRAVEVDREYVDAYYNRGLIYLKQKRYNQAVQDFKETVKLDPESVDALCNLGNSYLHLGKTELALESYGNALSLAPDDPELYYNRAVIFLARGEKNKAIRDLKKAANLGYEPAIEYLKKGD